MDERQMPAVPGCVEGRRRLGEVVAYDSRVADLLVAERQLVVGKADGPGVMRTFGVFQGSGVERDRSRLLTTRERHAAVEPPERRQPRIGNGIADRVGRAAECAGCLGQIVL